MFFNSIPKGRHEDGKLTM